MPSQQLTHLFQQQQIMNFTDFIQVELRALQKFTKQPALVLKTRTMLSKLSTFRQQNRSFRISIEQNTFNTTHDLLEIATSVFETKNEKIILHGLIIIQKLMNIRKLSMVLQRLIQEEYDEIVSHLSCMKYIEDKDLQMRIIQICLNLITPELVLVENFEFIRKIYHVCFYVVFSKDLMIRKIAISSLLQLTEFIFDEARFAGYKDEELKRCFGMFNDFLNYLIEQKNQWIPKGLNVIIWDLILEIIKVQKLNIISAEYNTIQKIQKFYDICLKKSFVKQVEKESKFDLIRYFRALCYITVNLNIGVKQLDRLKVVTDLGAGFLQLLYVEGAVLVVNSELMLTRAHAYPELVVVMDVLAQVVEELCQRNQSLVVPENSGLSHSNNNNSRSYLSKATVLLQIDTAETIDDSVIFKAIANGIIDLRHRLEQELSKNNTQTRQEEIKKSLQSLEPPLFKILRYFIMMDSGEKLIRTLVKQYQKWILIACRFKLFKLRNKFLQELNVLTWKLQKRTHVIKCIEAIQIMFNLIYGYDGFLDSSSLLIILFCFQQLEEKIQKLKKNKEWLNEMNEFEVENIEVMIEQLYTKDNLVFSEQTLKYTLESLNEITLKVMEQLSENPSYQYKLRLEYKTFGLRKMKEIIGNNLQKLASIWDLFVAQFICLSNSRNEEIRRYSIEVLMETMNKVLLKGMVPQKQLFSIYFELIKTRYVDVKVFIVGELKGFVENYGGQVEEGSLVNIFKILKLMEEPEEKGYEEGHKEKEKEREKQKDQIEQLLKVEYSLNELLMKQCLPFVEDIENVKEIIMNFRIIHSSKSNEYSSVGLLWLIPDHLKRKWIKVNADGGDGTANSPSSLPVYNEPYLDLFSLLFHKLSLIIKQSLSPAMRNSAIHIITQILAENLPLFPTPFLRSFLREVFFKILHETTTKYIETVNIVKDPESELDKDRCQTCKEMQGNLIKVLKMYEGRGVLEREDGEVVEREVERALGVERGVFLYNLLVFLRGYQEEILKGRKEWRERGDNEEENEKEKMQDLLKSKLEKIDHKDRYIKAKVLGILKEAIEYYNLK